MTDRPDFEDDDDEIDALTTKRREMLSMLCDDLNAQGWDQKQKLWIVEGAPEDEYLTMIGEFVGGARCILDEKAMKGTLKEHVTGVVISTESWTYPEEVSAGFKTTEAIQAYRKLVPPHAHPKRQEARTVILVSRDGEAVSVTVNRQTEKRRYMGMERGTECPTVDPVVDAARALLGTNKEWLDRLTGIQGAFASATAVMGDIMENALKNDWDEERIAVEILKHSTEEQREAFLTIVPDETRERLLRAEKRASEN